VEGMCIRPVPGFRGGGRVKMGIEKGGYVKELGKKERNNFLTEETIWFSAPNKGWPGFLLQCNLGGSGSR
jgi:hypothetical protein